MTVRLSENVGKSEFYLRIKSFGFKFERNE